MFTFLYPDVILENILSLRLLVTAMFGSILNLHLCWENYQFLNFTNFEFLHHCSLECQTVYDS